MSSALLGLGGAIAALNFYLSFVRVPMLRRLRRPAEPEFVSGVPLVGSLLLLLAWGVGLDSTGARVAACVLFLIDTGGPHWFLFTLATRGRSSTNGTRR
jgi:hypothetical protein